MLHVICRPVVLVLLLVHHTATEKIRVIANSELCGKLKC